jgi:hypothetical protein
MRTAPATVAPAIVGGPDEDAAWVDLGVHAEDVAAWKAEGFGRFDAALAQGDGFTPSIAVHYRRQLRRVARTWVRQGLDSLEGLRWHRAGFAAADALRWRSQGVDVATARIRRDGYERESARRSLPEPGTQHIDQKKEEMD